MIIRLFGHVARKLPIQMFFTVVFYFLYAAVFGVSIVPSIHIVSVGIQRLDPFGAQSVGVYLQFGVLCGVALFAYYMTSVLVIGVCMRLSSLGFKPGRYPAKSFTAWRWLVHGGFFGIAKTMFLPMIRSTGFANIFFRIAGCKIGRNVKINSGSLVDCYLLSIGDNVVVGGDALITCHIVENMHLILERVEIGSNTLIGAQSYITPGITIGENSVIGIGTYLRKGTTLPANSRITSLAGVSYRQAREIERGLDRFYLRKAKDQVPPPETEQPDEQVE